MDLPGKIEGRRGVWQKLLKPLTFRTTSFEMAKKLKDNSFKVNETFQSKDIVGGLKYSVVLCKKKGFTVSIHKFFEY